MYFNITRGWSYFLKKCTVWTLQDPPPYLLKPLLYDCILCNNALFLCLNNTVWSLWMIKDWQYKGYAHITGPTAQFLFIFSCSFSVYVSGYCLHGLILNKTIFLPVMSLGTAHTRVNHICGSDVRSGGVVRWGYV